MNSQFLLVALLVLASPLTHAFSNPGHLPKPNKYDRLNAFEQMTDADTLLSIWGEEASENIHNRTLGVDRYAPIFSGSYDWHSAVHGHLAVVYAGKKQNNPSLVAKATSFYNPAAVNRALSYKRKPLERTYGQPWLLIHASYLGSVDPQAYNTLRPLVEQAYTSACNEMNNVSDAGYLVSVNSGYKNFNFVAFGIYSYGKFAGKHDACMSKTKATIERLAPSINWSAPENQVARSDFFDPKAIAFLAFLQVGLNNNNPAWNTLVSAYRSTPINLPNNLAYYHSHGKGRVVSSAWGYWLMYRHTGDGQYKQAFINVLNLAYQNLKQQQGRGGHYFKNDGHWIPHMGTFALMLSNGDISFDFPTLTP